MGMYEQAEEMYLWVIEKSQASLGVTHLDSLIVKRNYAMVLSSLGKHEEAKKVSKEVIRKCEEILESGHLETLMAKRCFAIIL